MMRPLLVAASLLLAIPAIASEIYTWKDKNGQVQYSDTPPPGVDARPIKAQPSSLGVGNETKALQEKERSFDERQKARNEAAKKSADETAVTAAEKQRCDDMRTRLQNFQIGGRIAKIQDGERVIIGDEERQAETEKLKAAIAKDCR